MARWRKYLDKQSIPRGAVVAIVARNGVDFATVLFATVSGGRIYTGINPAYTPGDCEILCFTAIFFFISTSVAVL